MSRGFTASLVFVLALALLVGLLTAHSQSQAIAAPPTPTALPTPIPSPTPHHIDIVPQSNGSSTAAYDPATYTARVGEKITWVNTTSTDETVTDDNGAFDSGVLSPRQSFSWTPKTPGTYHYASFADPNLSGVLVVNP